MGLYRFKPNPSSRMGILWTISTIKDVAVVEFGCMGHMRYNNITLDKNGVNKEAKLYSTHINETDIAFGDTSRVEKVIDEVIKKDNPKVIFLLPSSVPQIIGTDMDFVCRELQMQYKETKILYIPYGSFDITYNEAIEKTLLFLVKKLSLDIDRSEETSYNILGSCADIYKFKADTDEIIRILESSFNMKVNCILTSDTDISDIENISRAHINIVLREEGLKAAKYLEKKYKIPYLYDRPYGINSTLEFIDKVAKILDIEKDEAYIKRETDFIRARMKPIMPTLVHGVRMHEEETTISLGGHIDVVKGIRKFAIDELSFHEGKFWCDSRYLADEEIPYYEENEWIELFENHKEGIIMFTGEALEAYNMNLNFQIANPDMKWRINSYVPPFLGFRGSLELLNIWINEIDHK